MIWWSKQQLKSKDQKSRLRAIEKLVAEGGTKACEVLAEVLADGDPEVRKDMAAALGQLGEESGVEPLAAALRDPHENVRAAAAKALGRIRSPQGVHSLVSALQDTASVVRWSAAKSLDEIGWQPADGGERAMHLVALGKYEMAASVGAAAIDAISLILRNGRYQERHSAVQALSHIPDARVQKTLIAALNDKEDQVRCAAIEGLRKLADPATAPPVIPALQDPFKNVRAAAAEALGQLNNSQALEPLRRALMDNDWEVRAAAALAVARLRDLHSLDPLIALLNDREHEVRETAARSLEMLGDREAITALVIALKDEKPNVRQRAMAALNVIDRHWAQTDEARAAAPQLQEALKHPEYWVRQAAADTLARLSQAQTAELRGVPVSQPAVSAPLHFRRQAAIETFVAMLSDFDRELRLAATEALGRIGQLSSVPALTHAAKDPEEAIRHSAARALALLQAGQIMPEEKPVTADKIFPF
jgi:HEAT repeat protein